MRIGLICAWYDLWIGAYWDRKRRWLYLLPFPCLGIVLKFNRRDRVILVRSRGSGPKPLEVENDG